MFISLVMYQMFLTFTFLDLDANLVSWYINTLC